MRRRETGRVGTRIREGRDEGDCRDFRAGRCASSPAHFKLRNVALPAQGRPHPATPPASAQPDSCALPRDHLQTCAYTYPVRPSHLSVLPRPARRGRARRICTQLSRRSPRVSESGRSAPRRVRLPQMATDTCSHCTQTSKRARLISRVFKVSTVVQHNRP